MQMQARILTGKIKEFHTKKGTVLAKASVKVADVGHECATDMPQYWIDFIGDSALTEVELDSIVGNDVTVDIRFARASTHDGRAYLNVAGGTITQDGKIVQSGLRNKQQKRAS